jgi:hypothetical protein
VCYRYAYTYIFNMGIIYKDSANGAAVAPNSKRLETFEIV